MKISEVKNLCTSPLICHNSRFEHKWLLSRGIDSNIIDDTFLMAYLVDERLPLDLQSLCLKFGVDIPFKEEYGKNVALITGERLIERNVRDARNTYLLRDILWSKMTEGEKKLYNKVLLPASKSLAKIELNGFCYNPAIMTGVCKEIQSKMDELDLQNDSIVIEFNKNSDKPFNVNSPLHKLILIYDMLGYKPLPFNQAWNTDKNGERTNPKTGVKILKKLLAQKPSKTLDKIIKYVSLQGWKRNYEKLEEYCDKCGDTHVYELEGKHYVATNLRFGATTTGRVASNHPNMQNNPSREGGWTRRGFISRYPNGVLMEADYSQIELKILAAKAQETVLINKFLKDVDVHTEMAKIAFNLTTVSKEQRDDGKTLNYSIPFGRGAGGIAFDTGRDISEARRWLKRFWKIHPTLKKYLTNLPKNGIIVSPTGMKRHCETWTQVKNFPIQNTALVVLLVAINRLIDNLKYSDLVLCIHDSLIFDVRDKKNLDKAIAEVREGMEFKPYELFSWMPIPFTVDFKAGENWGNMEAYND